MVRCSAVTVNVVAVTKSTHQHRSLGYSREAAKPGARSAGGRSCTSMGFATRTSSRLSRFALGAGVMQTSLMPNTLFIVVLLCLLIAAIALALHRRAQLRHLALVHLVDRADAMEQVLLRTREIGRAHV